MRFPGRFHRGRGQCQEILAAVGERGEPGDLDPHVPVLDHDRLIGEWCKEPADADTWKGIGLFHENLLQNPNTAAFTVMVERFCPLVASIIAVEVTVGVLKNRNVLYAPSQTTIHGALAVVT